MTEATYTVLGTETVGDDIPVTIPWSYIEARGNVDVPVHYRISGPGSPNEQHSVAQVVAVNAITIVPDAPTFLALSATDYLNCASLYDRVNISDQDPAIRVQVPDLTRYGLTDGDKVRLHWEAYPTPSSTTPITSAGMDFEIELGTPDYPATGFIWRVRPYDEKILPTYDQATNINGRGETWYTYVTGTETIVSKKDVKFVGMYDSLNNSRTLENPWPPVP